MKYVSRLPSHEEWEEIQGGEPTLIQSPSGKVVEIIHDYFRGEEYVGFIVPTPMEQIQKSLLPGQLGHLVLNNTVDDIIIPNTLLLDRHGKPCQERSGLANAQYERLETTDAAKKFIEDRINEGWQQRILNPKSAD